MFGFIVHQYTYNFLFNFKNYNDNCIKIEHFGCLSVHYLKSVCFAECERNRSEVLLVSGRVTALVNTRLHEYTDRHEILFSVFENKSCAMQMLAARCNYYGTGRWVITLIID